jgi:1-acyl-sn-glycerol-3-phosphate acyltransferase
MKKNSMMLIVLSSVIRFLFAVLARVEVEGLENVPRQGGAILAANHLGRLDSPLVYTVVRRDNLTGLVAEKYQNKPFFRWLVNLVGGIWINRQQADFRALREAREYLQQGGMLGIAPEGTRSTTGALTPAKTGVAYLADKADVPIIPVGITGTEKAFHELFRLRRPRLKVRFGRPFKLPPLKRDDRSGSLKQNTDEIMCQIAFLLPLAYRGAYTGHPRLQELESNLPHAEFS